MKKYKSIDKLVKEIIRLESKIGMLEKVNEIALKENYVLQRKATEQEETIRMLQQTVAHLRANYQGVVPPTHAPAPDVWPRNPIITYWR